MALSSLFDGWQRPYSDPEIRFEYLYDGGVNNGCMPFNTGTTVSIGGTRSVAATLALLVALSMVAVGATVGVTADETDDFEIEVDEDSPIETNDPETIETDDPEALEATGGTFSSADELHYQDDGSGVLVYTDDDEDVDEYRLGADVSEAMAHVLIAGDHDADEDVEGSFSAVLEDDLFTADGMLTMEQPPELEELDVEMTAEQTAETNEFDADIYALIGGGEDETQQLSTAPQAQQAQLFDSAETSGEVDVTAETFATSGDASVELGAFLAEEGEDERFAFELSELEDGYEISVSERETIQDFGGFDDGGFDDGIEDDGMENDPFGDQADPEDEWGTEANAQETLEDEYGDIVDDIGGEVTIEIDHHEFEELEESTYWKELDYTITYEGIDEGLEDAIAEELVDDPDAEFTQEEAEAIASQVTELEIETVEFELESGDGAFEATWNVEINEYAALLEAFVEVSEAAFEDEEFFDDEFEEFEETFEAQQAADLRTTIEWDVYAAPTETGQIELEATATSDTENYAAYVEELQDRGVDTAEEELFFEFTAYTEDGEIHVDGELEIGMDDLAETALTSVTQGMQDDSDELGSFASTLADSELELAKVDVDVDSETVTLEAGAEFDDVDSLVDDGMFGDSLVVTEIAGEDQDDELVTFVSIDDVDEELSEDELEELGLIDDQTTVYEPGEGDRELSTASTEEAASFLELDSGDSIAGFGVVAALAAIGVLGVVLLARRQ